MGAMDDYLVAQMIASSACTMDDYLVAQMIANLTGTRDDYLVAQMIANSSKGHTFRECDVITVLIYSL